MFLFLWLVGIDREEFEWMVKIEMDVLSMVEDDIWSCLLWICIYMIDGVFWYICFCVGFFYVWYWCLENGFWWWGSFVFMNCLFFWMRGGWFGWVVLRYFFCWLIWFLRVCGFWWVNVLLELWVLWFIYEDIRYSFGNEIFLKMSLRESWCECVVGFLNVWFD